MADERRALLDLAAEQAEQLESAQARIADLESRLRVALGLEPPMPTMAEIMLGELYDWLKANPSVTELLPAGFWPRLAAQMSPAITVSQEALDVIDKYGVPAQPFGEAGSTIASRRVPIFTLGNDEPVGHYDLPNGRPSNG